MSKRTELLNNGIKHIGGSSRRSVLKGTMALGTAAALGAVSRVCSSVETIP